MAFPSVNQKCSKAIYGLVVVMLFGSYFCPPAEAANILFFIAFGGPSHRLGMQPLADGLSAKGHNVTFLVQQKPKDEGSKINYYVPPKLSEYFKNMMGGVNFYEQRVAENPLRTIFIQWFTIQACENLYTDPDYLNWLRANKFDLVIIDGLLNECAYGVAHLHKAKTMLFSVSTILPWIKEGLGIPDETSSLPDPMLTYPQERTFFQRALTAICPVFWKLFRQAYYFPALQRITKEGLDDESVPSFSELERNTSLVLVNTHVAQEYPRSLPPNFIPVGGMSWVDKNNKKPLPNNIEDFINQGKEGFVYVSFGSFIDFLTFPEDVQQRFINALLKFPNIQFIWKLSKTPPNLPKNFLVEKWLPQQDLLLHPKIRAFITHSGIGGVTEAIYSSVPLICFPIMSEQDYNAFLVEKKGFGIKMEITALTEDKLEKAIKEILSNDSYRVNMQRVTKQFLDRPMKAVDTALWWTEYVLRQESTDFLRPLNVDQPWWVKRQVDVWLFVLTSILAFNLLGIYVTFKVCSMCINRARGNKNQKVSSKKQKQT